ncbi:protein NATD1-like isoform X2 [Ornithodoros turicata]|uniref:protein NATD1-like isoform X2 n=1 Tax=Ornithodoros turicata TaxID=34597 RepID=UPI003139EC36
MITSLKMAASILRKALGTVPVHWNARTSFVLMSAASRYSSQPFHVEHDEKNKEFFIRLGKDKAVLQYEVVNATTLDLVHTEVPESMRGQGIAKHLAKGAFDHIASKNIHAKVTCPYTAKYVRENADELKHLVK